ncbi:TlpA family protein disulfide reductase [Cognataquiflexum rubidum]|uniref:TlpA family protein disulfide reductase n=1 Tax=Cognataquiflexum rubidum TaxID=2922273 RepID=UPI001F13DC95|nr:TlpA disulfide reductase family protein [Cognataquiflexum rubidum]MCH6235139.1 TlpA family protein disulfide reductase [Cognataquiflexum rubidum]
MKNLFLSVLAANLLFFSCGKNPEVIDNSIIIAGKLGNSESPIISVSHDYEEITQDSVKSDGSFVLDFDYEETGIYSLSNGDLRFSLYLNPGDSIFVTGDSKEFEQTFTASGDMAQENEYLNKRDYFLYESRLYDYYVLMALKKDAYFSKKDSIIFIAKTFYEELKSTEGIDTAFLSREESYFIYQGIFMDQLYPMYHALANKIPQDSVDFPIEEIRKKIENLPMDNPELLRVEFYVYLTQRRIGSLANDIMKADSSITAFEMAEWIAIDSLIKVPEMGDFFKYGSIKRSMEYRGPLHVEEVYNKFILENSTPKYVKRLEKVKAKWEPISPGKTVPDFTFTDIKGDSVKLSDLKGKLVYIDIWATWCGPCIAEHPNWDKVKEEYKDKPVVFLTVSIDDTREPWEKMVKNKKMDGLQWFAANAWQSELTQFFMVNSIPRFILLDKEGKIIDPSTERPSGNIREILDKHLAGVV